MMGLAVGAWEDEVDPDRVIKGVVGDCQAFLEDDTLHPTSPLKKRKQVVDGIESSILDSSRSSKRLRGLPDPSRQSDDVR